MDDESTGTSSGSSALLERRCSHQGHRNGRPRFGACTLYNNAFLLFQALMKIHYVSGLLFACVLGYRVDIREFSVVQVADRGHGVENPLEGDALRRRQYKSSIGYSVSVLCTGPLTRYSNVTLERDLSVHVSYGSVGY